MVKLFFTEPLDSPARSRRLRATPGNEEGNDLTILKVEEYWEYEYDLLNRMTGVSKWDEEAGDMVPVKSYRYNGSNYRVLSTDSEGDSTYYTFDPNGQMVEKTTIEDTTETTRDYIYLGTRIIAHVEDGETYYYGTDHIGSTSMMTDESCAVVLSGEVTPFADSESTSDDSEHVLYTGKELDEATGLYYYNFELEKQKIIRERRNRKKIDGQGSSAVK